MDVPFACDSVAVSAWFRSPALGESRNSARNSPAEGEMIGTLRNVFLSRRVVVGQIPGCAPVDYFEPVGGGEGPISLRRRWPRWKKEKEQSGEEFENGRRRPAGRTAAAQCTRERVFLAGMDLVQTVFLLFNNGTFPQTGKRVRPPRDNNRVVSLSATQFQFPTIQPLAFGSIHI